MKNWNPKDWIALVIALIILTFVLSGTIASFIRVADGNAITPEAIGMWKDIMLILVGALATWLGGKD